MTSRSLSIVVTLMVTLFSVGFAEKATAQNNLSGDTSITKITKIVVDDSTLYAICAEGLIVYDLSKNTYRVIRIDDNLEAIAVHNGVVYVGSRYLYQFDGTKLEVVLPLGFNITCLYSYDNQLMIGTERGLLSPDTTVHEIILKKGTVSAMVADDSGLWVGTTEQGLYRWTGEKFVKRFIGFKTPRFNAVDTIYNFDTVNVLTYNNGSVYVGTPQGMQIFDAASTWKIVTTAEGLPSSNVRAINASTKIVYVATDRGVVFYSYGEFESVESLEYKRANALYSQGPNLIVTTNYDGILKKSGNDLKILVPSGR